MPTLYDAADIVPIRRALLSVADKRGLVELGRALAQQGAHLLASGGTRLALVEAGLAVTEVSIHTGQPEILGGRVKTLHPKIHGGILARRDNPDDLRTLEADGIDPIDLVVVDLYPFEEFKKRPVPVPDDEMIEQIDIGGVALIRGAAKNHAHVAIVVEPGQYSSLLEQLQACGGTTREWRRDAARKAFAHTARYDWEIADYFLNAGGASRPRSESGEVELFPSLLHLGFERRSPLRYGENPHQRAALYVEPSLDDVPVLANAKPIHGKELSYNNLLDADSALRLLQNFDANQPTAVLLKHNNPCGAAIATNAADAFELAYDGDPVSAFGGIVGLNAVVDLATAERMAKPGRFLEVILAVEFTPEAREWLTTKPSWRNSVRLLELRKPIGRGFGDYPGWDFRRIGGGLLVQEWDAVEDLPAQPRLAAKRPPTLEERESLEFAWRICQGVRSNAIVLANGKQIVGVGAGQMSRLDSVRIAIEKAGDKAKGAVLASDAFFPFRDGPDLAAKAGVTAIIQPGGSKRDDETFQACDEHGMAMILTGRRHFRH